MTIMYHGVMLNLVVLELRRAQNPGMIAEMMLNLELPLTLKCPKENLMEKTRCTDVTACKVGRTKARKDIIVRRPLITMFDGATSCLDVVQRTKVNILGMIARHRLLHWQLRQQLRLLRIHWEIKQ